MSLNFSEINILLTFLIGVGTVIGMASALFRWQINKIKKSVVFQSGTTFNLQELEKRIDDLCNKIDKMESDMSREVVKSKEEHAEIQIKYHEQFADMQKQYHELVKELYNLIGKVTVLIERHDRK